MKQLFQLLLIVLASQITTGCATTPALHVIGVYEGQTPPGSDNSQGVDPRIKNLRVIPPTTASDSPGVIYTRRAPVASSSHPEKEVIVKISDDTEPIVLVLTAYDKTLWKLSIGEGVRITKVILGGYHSQRVTGLPPGMPIEVYTHEPSPCDNCWQSPEYFYSYKTPPKELKKITDLPVTSFQGKYTGSEFSIFQGIKQYR